MLLRITEDEGSAAYINTDKIIYISEDENNKYTIVMEHIEEDFIIDSLEFSRIRGHLEVR